MAYKRYSTYSKEEKIKAFRFTTFLFAVMAIIFFYLAFEIRAIGIIFGICMTCATILSLFKRKRRTEKGRERNKRCLI